MYIGKNKQFVTHAWYQHMHVYWQIHKKEKKHILFVDCFTVLAFFTPAWWMTFIFHSDFYDTTAVRAQSWINFSSPVVRVVRTKILNYGIIMLAYRFACVGCTVDESYCLFMTCSDSKVAVVWGYTRWHISPGSVHIYLRN